MWLIIVAACSGSGSKPATSDTEGMLDTSPDVLPGKPHDSDPADLPGDTDTADDPPDTDSAEPVEEDTGEPYSDGDFLFGVDMVHTIELTLSDEALLSLKHDPYTYVEGSATIDGETIDNIGVRLKGSGSFETIGQKAAFKVDFNYYEDTQEFHGLHKLTLNNMTHDTSQVHEVLAHEAFRMAGLPYDRVGYAWVTVNGDVYGLYANVELPCKGWMAREFGATDGRAYEGGYPNYPESYAHADFKPKESINFDLEVGGDVENEDVIEAAVEVSTAGDDWDDRVSEHIDLDEYTRFQMMEAWVGQWDGYAFASASNNYRVWVDTDGDGLIRFVPSGLDWTFTDYVSWDSSHSPVGKPCTADTTCRARYSAQVVDMLDSIDTDELEALHQEAWALIQDYVAEDPRKVSTTGTITKAQDEVTTWIATRSDSVEGWYGSY